jgi:hypothetical protein
MKGINPLRGQAIVKQLVQLRGYFNLGEDGPLYRLLNIIQANKLFTLPGGSTASHMCCNGILYITKYKGLVC